MNSSSADTSPPRPPSSSQRRTAAARAARGRRDPEGQRQLGLAPRSGGVGNADLPGNARDTLDRSRGSRGGTHRSGGTRTRRSRRSRRTRRTRRARLARRSHRGRGTAVVRGVLRITGATIFATGTTELGPGVTVRVEVAVGVRVGLRRGRSRGHPTDGDRQRGGCHHADKHLLHVASLLWRVLLTARFFIYRHKRSRRCTQERDALVLGAVGPRQLAPAGQSIRAEYSLSRWSCSRVPAGQSIAASTCALVNDVRNCEWRPPECLLGCVLLQAHTPEAAWLRTRGETERTEAWRDASTTPSATPPSASPNGLEPVHQTVLRAAR